MKDVVLRGQVLSSLPAGLPVGLACEAGENLKGRQVPSSLSASSQALAGVTAPTLWSALWLPLTFSVPLWSLRKGVPPWLDRPPREQVWPAKAPLREEKSPHIPGQTQPCARHTPASGVQAGLQPCSARSTFAQCTPAQPEPTQAPWATSCSCSPRPGSS